MSLKQHKAIKTNIYLNTNNYINIIQHFSLNIYVKRLHSLLPSGLQSQRELEESRFTAANMDKKNNTN